MREIKIGDKPMRALTGEDLRRIVMIEGCCPVLEYWGEPVVSCFDGEMFRDSCLIEFTSVRNDDGLVSDEYWFWFQYDCERYSYCVNPRRLGLRPTRNNGNRPSLAALRYLIGAGFDVPLY